MKVGLWETDTGFCAGRQVRRGVKAKDDGRNGVSKVTGIDRTRGSGATSKRSFYLLL